MSTFKTLRKRTKITQIELSEKLNIDRSTVAKWETGRSKPRADMLVKLSEIFGCTVDELLRDGDERKTG